MLLWVFSSQSWWEWCILFSVQNGSCQWTPPTLISWITSITLDQIKRSITSSFIHGHAAETWHQKQGPHPLYDCLSYSSVGAGKSHSEKCSLLNNESNFLLRSCMHNVYQQLLEIWWQLYSCHQQQWSYYPLLNHVLSSIQQHNPRTEKQPTIHHENFCISMKQITSLHSFLSVTQKSQADSRLKGKR